MKTSPMRVVSNTSPICNLAIINRLELLRFRYGLVEIPVAEELSFLTHSTARNRIESAVAAGWLIVKPNPVKILQLNLDPGETASISLAQSEKAGVLLIDERRGRVAARSLAIKVAGILGELIYAKHAGSISSVKTEMYRLRTEARFFIDPAIERHILAEVAEA